MNPCSLHDSTKAAIQSYFYPQDGEKRKQVEKEISALVQKILFGDGVAVIELNTLFNTAALMEKELECLLIQLHADHILFEKKERRSASQLLWEVRIKLHEKVLKSINEHCGVDEEREDKWELMQQAVNIKKELIDYVEKIKTEGSVIIRDLTTSEGMAKEPSEEIDSLVRWLKMELDEQQISYEKGPIKFDFVEGNRGERICEFTRKDPVESVEVEEEMKSEKRQ